MNSPYVLPQDFKIVSGGQTGADLAALDWAIEAGFSHGGWCPKGRRTEDGVLADSYALKETPGKSYLVRTEWNVRDSDATVIFTMDDRLDGGSKHTATFAERLGKPWLHMRPTVHPRYLAAFVEKHRALVLNVAGKRASSAPLIYDLVLTSLRLAFQTADLSLVQQQTRRLEHRHCLPETTQPPSQLV